MRTITWLLYLSLCVYCMLDGLHTVILLEHGIEEGNPLMSFFIQNVGIWSMFAFKMTWLGLLGILLYRWMNAWTQQH
jgi:hypothetical protein